MRLSERDASGACVLASSAFLCAVLGSVHAFSVFLEPLEAAFGTGRATVSLTYSFALVALTLAVLFGPRVYAAVSPGILFIAAGLIGALGAGFAGMANDIWGVWLGFSLCFGIANGLGYGFALQFAARANPGRSGLAMGIVTASYALGAVISPLIFVEALEVGGFGGAMSVLAVALLIVSAGGGWVVHRTGLGYDDTTGRGAADMPPAPVIARIWLAYGAGVAAGLMAIGHAAAFADLAGVTPWHAPAVLAMCNLLGSLAGGHLTDRFLPRAILTALPVISVAGLVTLALFPTWTLAALGALGFAYGGTIAAYPSVIARLFPGQTGPRVYGLVFTAWGAAGLAAPWSAGLLFDKTESYASALLIAAVLAALSAGLASRIFRASLVN